MGKRGWSGWMRGCLPHGNACQSSPREKHAQVDRARLDGGTNGDKDAHHLHEAHAAHLVGHGRLDEGTDCLAGNVDGDDLAGLASRFKVSRVVNIPPRSSPWRDDPCIQSSFHGQWLDVLVMGSDA